MPSEPVKTNDTSAPRATGSQGVGHASTAFGDHKDSSHKSFKKDQDAYLAGIGSQFSTGKDAQYSSTNYPRKIVLDNEDESQ